MTLAAFSPVTPDYINPGHPWPHLDRLATICAERGYRLRPRPPIYDSYIDRPEFLAERLRQPTRAVRDRLGGYRPSQSANSGRGNG